jgi:hypothetical protein
MSGGWQDFAVLAMVSIAVAYLALRGWRSVTRRGPSGCAGCPSRGGKGPVDQVVSIGGIKKGRD